MTKKELREKILILYEEYDHYRQIKFDLFKQLRQRCIDRDAYTEAVDMINAENLRPLSRELRKTFKAWKEKE